MLLFRRRNKTLIIGYEIEGRLSWAAFALMGQIVPASVFLSNHSFVHGQRFVAHSS
jgi:hypothetical protein